ncbi:exported hypothetical protein [Candidatus Terasakiella magnetica]|uniref:Solute-binding protein family 3/N-terminal domain-containing protein n=1 Tax=Candidatus Terasakiella magnetica TaxID=1867952 RepID=A0A1C3RJR6_9PROT|nr:transporter substrate-binding domain-containing protein [Candidatus Terasakiella magnetica]SCA57516.1 exported hypothetical protein [Candidatus Terasakiella magnetica]
MRFLIIVCTLLLFVSFTKSSHAKEQEAISVCYLNWGKQGGKNLPNQGFIPDLLSEILTEAGYTPKVDIIPWLRCLDGVKNHKYDFVGSYWIGGEGDGWFDYFLPTTVDRINFVTLKNKAISSGQPEAFLGKRVGFLKGAGGLERIRAHSDRINLYEATTDLKLLTMLKHGRLDGIVSNSPHIIGLAETSFPEVVKELVTLQPALQINIASPAIAIDNPRRREIKERYNAAYLKLKKAGIYDRLMKKHDIRVDYEMTSNERAVFDAAQKNN